MQEKSKRSVVFAVVAVLALGSTIAGAGFGRGARGHFAETKSRLLFEPSSASAREAPVKALPEYRIAKQDLAAASLATGRTHRPAAALALVRVVERADKIDRGNTLVASLVAAKLFDGVAERVDADPALLEDPFLAAALRRASFRSSRRPLEAERRHALGVLANVPAQVPFRTAGFAESTTTQAMEDVDATLREMESSALAGDLAQCERAAERPMGLAKQVTVGPSICKSALRVVEGGRRLQRLRARASGGVARSRTAL